MSKSGLILGGYGLLIVLLGLSLWLYGRSERRGGFGECLILQANVDKNHALATMDKWNDNIEKLSGDAPKILISDPSTTGPAISGWLSNTEAPRPASKPSGTP